MYAIIVLVDIEFKQCVHQPHVITLKYLSQHTHKEERFILHMVFEAQGQNACIASVMMRSAHGGAS
jgi:hypothetical protein